MSRATDTIAIVGGGPAGALAAAALAQTGVAVTLYDEKLAWEKPCGGGLTAKALERYPFLGRGCNWVRECELIAPSGRRALLALDRPIAIYAREQLNAQLLARAQQAGATLVRDRVVAIEAAAGAWRLRLREGGTQTRARLVVAAGARSRLQAPFATPLPAADMLVTAGYFVPAAALPWPSHRIIVQFLAGREGYIWSFPRVDHASIGACGRFGAEPTAAVRRRLEAWLEGHGIGAAAQASTFFAHVLPAAGAAWLRQARFEGNCNGAPWALIGDAAGLVDPITGEGLYYALRSAELLAEAWSRAEAYEARVAAELVPELATAARLSDRFYFGRFLGDLGLERMLQFTARSRRFRRLMCNLFAGAQEYRTLRTRVYRSLPGTALDLALSLLHAPRRTWAETAS